MLTSNKQASPTHYVTCQLPSQHLLCRGHNINLRKGNDICGMNIPHYLWSYSTTQKIPCTVKVLISIWWILERIITAAETARDASVSCFMKWENKRHTRLCCIQKLLKLRNPINTTRKLYKLSMQFKNVTKS